MLDESTAYLIWAGILSLGGLAWLLGLRSWTRTFGGRNSLNALARG